MMADDIEDINALLNRDHCKSNYDLNQHYESFLSKDSVMEKSTLALNQMDNELKSIFEEIDDDENHQSDGAPGDTAQPATSGPASSQPATSGSTFAPLTSASASSQPAQHRIMWEDDDDAVSVISDVSHHSTAVPVAPNKIKSALKSYNDVLDVEMEYDNTKYVLLEEIDEFQDQLILDEILPGKKYNVNVNTPLSELQAIREMLKIKYDKSRFTNTGIKTIELAAYVLEKIFDGSRSIGSFTLNLTGWHKTMKLKTKYLRTDISECVETYISPTMTPGTRVFFDIFLNMIFYGTTNHISKNIKLQDAYEKLSSH
jgi:hypothetical protein